MGHFLRRPQRRRLLRGRLGEFPDCPGEVAVWVCPVPAHRACPSRRSCSVGVPRTCAPSLSVPEKLQCGCAPYR